MTAVGAHAAEEPASGRLLLSQALPTPVAVDSAVGELCGAARPCPAPAGPQRKRGRHVVADRYIDGPKHHHAFVLDHGRLDSRHRFGGHSFDAFGADGLPDSIGTATGGAMGQLLSIGRHDRLAGVKDSSGDRAELQRLTERFSDGAYFVGNDQLVRSCIEAGGRGSITAAASVAPRLVRAVQMGEAEQEMLDRARGLLEEYGLGPAVKAILKRKGLGVFATRPPLRELESERADELWDRVSRL